MGFLDKLKETANMAKQKATGAVDQHGPQLKEGIGKAGNLLDKKTKGKYSDKIAKGTSKATEAVDKQSAAGGGGVTPPAPQAGHQTPPAAQHHQPPAGTTHTPPTEPGATI